MVTDVRDHDSGNKLAHANPVSEKKSTIQKMLKPIRADGRGCTHMCALVRAGQWCVRSYIHRTMRGCRSKILEGLM